MALTSRIHVPDLGPEPEIEDIYAIHLAYLFTDHIPNAHGDPGTSIIYKSPLYGEILLSIPKHPQLDSDRQLFAHYLWNAAVIAAEGIESASVTDDARKARSESKDYAWQEYNWDPRYWDMRGAKVLELGAGTALPSILSALSHAESVTTTDHPSSTAITTGTISTNLHRNITTRTHKPLEYGPQSADISHGNDTLPSNVNVYGYLWGETQFHDHPSTSDSTASVSTAHQPSQKSFSKIIIADCLWIPSKHSSLVKTILDYLEDAKDMDRTSKMDEKTMVPCALVIAGFHTGRAITSDFFSIATDEHVHTASRVHYDKEPIFDENPLTARVRGQLKIAEIFEVDIDGKRRNWMASRPGETMEDAKRWCVCAALVRK